MKRKVINKSDSHKKLIDGINLLGDTVGETLGPAGRTVIYQRTERMDGLPTITKDGVTVAHHVESQDPIENIGIMLVKDAARKTAMFAGDGTTTSTVLTQEILNKAFEGDIKSPRAFVQGMEEAARVLTKSVDDAAVKLTPELIKYVATISANNSSTLGNIIAEAYDKAGEHGYVGYEINQEGQDTKIDVRNGAWVDAPLLDENFITDKASRSCIQDNPLIFVSTAKIDTPRQLESILEYATKEKRALTIIADAEVGVYQVLAINASKHNYKFNALTPYGVGPFLKEELSDIAAVTGATLHGDHLGDDVDLITPDMLGECQRLISDKKGTVLEFEKRAAEADEVAKGVEVLLEKEQTETRRETLKKRLATLKGCFAMIQVGAPTGVELNEKLDLVEDAVKAVHSSKEEGIIPGGGNLLRVSALQNAKTFDKEHEDYQKGYDAVLWAAEKPFERILQNADIEIPDELGREVSGLSSNIGVDATSGAVCDLLENGIVDPAFVTKQAIENSVSVAKTVVTSSSTIINLPQ